MPFPIPSSQPGFSSSFPTHRARLTSITSFSTMFPLSFQPLRSKFFYFWAILALSIYISPITSLPSSLALNTQNIGWINSRKPLLPCGNIRDWHSWHGWEYVALNFDMCLALANGVVREYNTWKGLRCTRIAELSSCISTFCQKKNILRNFGLKRILVWKAHGADLHSNCSLKPGPA